MKLSERLQLIADQIELGETMADIGTDHGFLPIYLKRSGICPKVTLTDVSQGSLDKAREDCAKFAPGEEFDFRCGSGLSVLTPGEVDAVVIAGMGGILMSDIIREDLDVAKTVGHFILQPRRHPSYLRYQLYDMGFDMDRELLVRERKYIWEIMVCHYSGEHIGEADAVSDTSLWYFPDLLTENDNSILMPYLELALEKQNFVYERIRGSEDPRIEETENRIRRIEHLIEEVR